MFTSSVLLIRAARVDAKKAVPIKAAATITVQAKKVSKELEGSYVMPPCPDRGSTIVNALPSRVCESTKDR